MSKQLDKAKLLEWLHDKWNRFGANNDLFEQEAIEQVTIEVKRGAFDAEPTGEIQRLRAALERIRKITKESREAKYHVDNYLLIEVIAEQALSATTESTCKCGGTGGYNLKFGQLGEETFPCEVCSADFFKKTGLERVREYCPDHPDVKPETSSSHTWTQDGNTYFVSYVKYCPTCYRVISTEARL